MYIEKPDYQNLFHERPLHSLGELFYENTKLNRINSRPLGIHIGIILSVPYFTQFITNAYKCYPHATAVPLEPRTVQKEELPTPESRILEGLTKCLELRRSAREFSTKPLEKDDVARILQYSYGVTKEFSSPNFLGGSTVRFRAIPSAGGVFPLEVYPICMNVEGLDPGVYHYNVRDDALELLKGCDSKDLTEKCIDIFTMVGITNPALVLAITGIFRRNTFKYMDRGYRFTFIEAGHLGQNIHLLTTAMGLGCVALGGFLDDEVNGMLHINGVEEGAVYALAIGTLSTTDFQQTPIATESPLL